MSTRMQVFKALKQLQRDLQQIDNPDREVGGLALPVLSYVVSETEGFLGSDPLVDALRMALGDERYSNEPMAGDILIVVGQLLARIGLPEEMTHVRYERSW